MAPEIGLKSVGTFENQVPVSLKFRNVSGDIIDSLYGENEDVPRHETLQLF